MQTSYSQLKHLALFENFSTEELFKKTDDELLDLFNRVVERSLPTGIKRLIDLGLVEGPEIRTQSVHYGVDQDPKHVVRFFNVKFNFPSMTNYDSSGSFDYFIKSGHCYVSITKYEDPIYIEDTLKFDTEFKLGQGSAAELELIDRVADFIGPKPAK